MNAKSRRDICRMTILYVEDDLDTAKMVLWMLAQNYPLHKVLHLENGLDALKKPKELFNADILLVDLYMPFLNGEELADLILHQEKKCPVIFLSVCNDPSTIRRCLSLGARYFISKPVDFDTLFCKIDTLMIETFYQRFGSSRNAYLQHKFLEQTS